MKLLFVLSLMVFMPTMVEPAPTEERPTWPRTTGSSEINLDGRMFTLSRNYGGVIFYHPNYHFQTPYPTRSYKVGAPNTTTKHPNTTTTTKHPNTTTTTKHPNATTTTKHPNTTTTKATTTQSPTRSVSVCLRYMTDAVQPTFPLFTLSPDTSPLSLQGSFHTFMLSYYGSFSVDLQPIVHLWPDIKQDIWTSVCLTVDTSKSVVQMFSGGYMSPRKVMPYQYVWSGEPVISFPGFDGQLTDVQVWDYPLQYRDIFYYMSRSYYGSYSGSVISWSNISYNNRGRAVLEDNFGMRAKVEQESRRREKKMRFFSVEENKLLL
ncbi:jeltraxin-like [Neolamprologus brichardi]|uniref:jeltraxin-like n=1 Tax=Neolamprologus brichardi TaxID=32507 RepID=UPI0003EC1ECB|nr:jeltraxin-like [Neolamprologus brichardi]